MKKIISMCMMLFCLGNVICMNANALSNIDIQPRFTYIISLGKTLNVSGGVATYGGTAEIDSTLGNKVYVTATLQQKNNGSWKSIESCSANSNYIASVSDTHSISSGYYYRTRVEVTVKNSNGSVVELVTRYSSEKYY